MTWLTTTLLSNAAVVVLLAIPAWLAGRAFQRPAVAHVLWALVLLKLVTPPVMPLPVPAPLARESQPEWWRPFDGSNASAGASRTATVVAKTRATANASPVDAHEGFSQESARAPLEKHNLAGEMSSSRRPLQNHRPSLAEISLLVRPWSVVIVLWIAGGAIWLCVQMAALSRLRGMIQLSTPAPARLAELADRCARDMGLPRAPQLRIIDNAASPMLYGFGRRACIVLPAELLRRLSPEAQSTILVHELAHFRRGDQFVRIIELLATTVFWWHPVVWWARRELEIAEEQCCDATVLRYCEGKARVYAEAILDIVDLISERRERVRPVLASGLRQRPALRRRLKDVMAGRQVPLLSRSGRCVLVVVGLACLACRPELAFSRAAARSRGDVAADLFRSDSKVSQIEVSTESIGDPRENPRLPPPPAPKRESAEWARARAADGRTSILARDGRHCVLVDGDGALVRDLSPYRITCVAYLPDGSRFITGELHGAVRLWQASSGREIGVLMRCAADVLSVDYSAVNDRVVVADRTGIVELWSLSRPEDRVRFARWPGAIRSVRFSPAGERLALVSDTWNTSVAGRIAVFDVVTGELQHDWRPAAPIGALRFESESCLLVAEWSGRVTPWRLSDGQLGEPYMVAKERVSAESYSAQAVGLQADASN